MASERDRHTRSFEELAYVRRGLLKTDILLQPFSGGDWAYSAGVDGFVAGPTPITVSFTIGSQAGRAAIRLGSSSAHGAEDSEDESRIPRCRKSGSSSRQAVQVLKSSHWGVRRGPDA